MTVAERLKENEYEEEYVVFSNPSYDDAAIGVSSDGRVVYDFQLMVRYLIEKENMTEEDAIEYIEYNTLRSLGYVGNNSPIVLYPFLI